MKSFWLLGGKTNVLSKRICQQLSCFCSAFRTTQLHSGGNCNAKSLTHRLQKGFFVYLRTFIRTRIRIGGRRRTFLSNATTNFGQLPENLPAPVDDGSCRHLPGMQVPSLWLQSTAGGSLNLAEINAPTAVVYCYPMTGKPGEPLPPGWDTIPGARGCTPETCSFRDHYQEMSGLGAKVLGISAQTTGDQQEMVERLHVPFEVLSDSDLALTRALNLPTFQIEGRTFIKRLTLILRQGRIAHVFYPIFPPNAHAEEVLSWLSRNAI
jgi:peroxiredoxin